MAIQWFDCPLVDGAVCGPARVRYPLTFFGVREMFPGPMQMVLVLFIILLLFGGAKVPSLMRNLGRGANEFKRGLAESDDDKATLEEKEKQTV